MKFLQAAFAVLILLPTAGCASTSLTALSTPVKQGLTVAHTLHDGAVLVATAAYQDGKCVGACKTQVQSYIDKSETLLVEADGLSNPADIQADIVAATALITTAKGLLP